MQRAVFSYISKVSKEMEMKLISDRRCFGHEDIHTCRFEYVCIWHWMLSLFFFFLLTRVCSRCDLGMEKDEAEMELQIMI